MGPRSRSRSVTPRRSYSRSPYRRSGRRHPPSPPPSTAGRHKGRYCSESRSNSRSRSSSYKKRHSSRRHYTRTRSRSKSRSRSRNSYDKNNRNNREKPLPCRCIGVFGLNVNTTQLKIREIFGKYGPIERIQVVIDAQTGRSRGFCFIYYDKLDDAKAACDNCCGMEIDGRRIRVAYSITERPHTPTPGVYMGRPASELRDRYRAEKYHQSQRHRYERSRSRSYSPPPRRYRYRYH
ncbi:transformer-2 sex-determining protein [Calliphora vicina]|uniref:transformer-2 sex-determining protein n=1 Tax=Calliphora vicina TaxID=7373 RepID=UPI00325A712A